MNAEKARTFRRLRRSIKTLSALLGILCVLMAAAIFGLSFRQNPHNRQRIHQVSQWLALSGAAMLGIRVLFFTIPARLERRRSPSLRRRDEIYRGRMRAMRRADRDRARRERASTSAPYPARNDGGSVLVIVLAMLAAVAALVLQVQLTARARLRSEEAALRRAGLVRAASDAARSALQRLADDPELLFDARDEAWAAREELRTPSGIDTLVVVTDENRLFDLNNVARRTDLAVRSPGEILVNLLNGAGRFDAGDLVSALRDWTDEDDDGGFESAIYRQRKPPYACPNRPLLAWTEVFDVAGWKRDLLARRPPSSLRGAFNADLADCVTVLPVQRERVLPVNVNTAGRDALLGVLGLEQDVLANAIISMRQLQPIQTIDAVQQLMEPALFAQVSPYLAVRSEFFRVDAQAFAEGAGARVRALAHRDAEGRVDVIQWLL